MLCCGFLSLSLRAEPGSQNPSQNPGPQFRTTAPPAAPGTALEAPGSPSRLAIHGAETLELLEKMNEADLAGAARFIAEHCASQTPPGDGSTHKADIQRLIKGVPGSIELLGAETFQTEQKSPFRVDLLDGGIGYLRLGAPTEDHIAELETALEGMTEKKVNALVLDLRASGLGGSADGLGQLCKLFCPKGKVLFRMRHPISQEERMVTSKGDPLYRGPLAVLTAADTGGIVEVAAEVLRTHAKAILFGSTTSGRMKEFAEKTLPSGILLRVASGEMWVSELGKDEGKGLKPDMELPASPSQTRTVLALAAERSLSELLNEPERPRLNEAALVAGTNPEWAPATSPQRTSRIRPFICDTVLQRAVDFCATVGIYEARENSLKPARTSRGR
jgi:hypothetical protein